MSPYVPTVRMASGARAVQIDSTPCRSRPRGRGTCGIRACLPGAVARTCRPIESKPAPGSHTPFRKPSGRWDGPGRKRTPQRARSLVRAAARWISVADIVGLPCQHIVEMVDRPLPQSRKRLK